jgi:hypothetical protein
MNLKHLNLDLYKIPENEEMQLAVFLIACDLKSRKLLNGLRALGCDGCFCVPDLCDLVLALTGFDDRPNALYDRYFNLLDEHCEKVTHKNALPIEEAVSIYKKLTGEVKGLVASAV